MKNGIVVLSLYSMVLFAACSTSQTSLNPSTNILPASQQASKIVQVVAAENFYGDIAKQIGGNHVNVTSILSDPTVDPHEYESTVRDAVHVSDADVVLYNALGYDSWMEKLIAASPNPNRVAIPAGTIVPTVLSDNPHIWYGPDNMLAVAQAVRDVLQQKDPADSADFDKNLKAFSDSIAKIQKKMSDIKTQFEGTPIALTETIGLYQTGAMGLKVLTPLEFEKAVSEGNDPSALDVLLVNKQIDQNQVKLLVYNRQTVTPITTNLLKEAKKQNIPQVYLTETMPQNTTYQTWMMDQLDALQQALQKVLQ